MALIRNTGETAMNKERSQAFMGRLIGDLATVGTVALVHVGERVGLFKAMAGAGAQTLAALEQRTGVHPRYLESWLSAMFVAGYIEHDAEADTWSLPDEHALFLADPANEYHLGGLFHGMPGLMAMAPKLAAAFESGEGIAFEAYGEGEPLAIELMNRSVYEARLVRQWMPALPAVVQRLQAGGRAIDIGCGTGLVPVLLAQAYPQAHFTGLDVDARSIEMAREKAQVAGVADRVQFICLPAGELPMPEGGWDFVSAFDCIHDLGNPDAVLGRVREALAPGGTFLMVEPRVGERLADDVANPFARMLHGISCLHCVPVSLAQGGPGLGACWGTAAARRAATRAGFGRFQMLPIRSPVQAFYELAA